jgi:hypothetical protein
LIYDWRITSDGITAHTNHHKLSSFLIHPFSSMLSSSDLLHLPYTPDLTEGGIAYALLSLPYRNLSDDQLRHRAADGIVELAFRRYLSQQDIPFEVKAATPFTDPARHDVLLGGRRCELKSFFISHRDQVSEIQRNPDILLSAPALVPSDHHIGEAHSDNDLYLFAFLSGMTAVSQADLRKIVESNQPHCLTCVMPEEWRKPFNWNPLGPLALKSESDSTMLIEIHGQDQGRGNLTRLVSLPPKTRVTVDDGFYSVTALHAKSIPSARIGIHSPVIKEAHVISPLEWKNIWVYGMEIILVGYIVCGEFRQRAKFIAPNSSTFQYDHTKTKNLAVPISNLNPLADLFARAHEWEAQREK